MKHSRTAKQMTAVCTVSTMVLAAQGTSVAATYRWTGKAGSSWDSSSSWLPKGVPGRTDTAIILAGVVDLRHDAVVGTLRLGEQAELSNSGQLTVRSIASQGLVTGSGAVVIPAGGEGDLDVSTETVKVALGRRALGAGNRRVPLKLAFQRIRNKGVISADLGPSTRLQFDSFENSGSASIKSGGEVAFSSIRNLSGGSLKLRGGSGVQAAGRASSRGVAAERGAGDPPPILLGEVVNEPGAQLTLQGDGDNSPEFLAQAFQNQGELNFENASTVVTSALSNSAGGQLALEGSTSLTAEPGHDPQLENLGTILKTGSGETVVGLDWVNRGQVSLEAGLLTLSSTTSPVQESGRLTLDGGDLQVLAGSAGRGTLILQGGILDGSGNIEGDVLNSGASINIGHSPGITSINGNYTQTTNGTLNMEIGGMYAGSGYDQLMVYGKATLAGTLNALKYGQYIPTVGATFSIIEYYDVAGNFNWTNLNTSVATYATKKTIDYYTLRCTSRSSSRVGTASPASLGINSPLTFSHPIAPRPVGADWKPATAAS